MDRPSGVLAATMSWLLGLVGGALEVIETMARRALAAPGATGALQDVLPVLLVIARFRMFGGAIAVLLPHALPGRSAARRPGQRRGGSAAGGGPATDGCSARDTQQDRAGGGWQGCAQQQGRAAARDGKKQTVL